MTCVLTRITTGAKAYPGEHSSRVREPSSRCPGFRQLRCVAKTESGFRTNRTDPGHLVDLVAFIFPTEWNRLTGGQKELVLK